MQHAPPELFRAPSHATKKRHVRHSRRRALLFLQSILLYSITIAAFIPSVILYFEGDADWQGFLYSSAITGFIATTCYIASRGDHHPLQPKQMFLATTLSWLNISFFACLPMVLGSSHMSFTDAVFESISGITTTGASIVSDIDGLSMGIKLWRGILQWIGGVGIIVMAIAILPFLQIGGMRMFKTESSDTSDKVLPRAGSVAIATSIVYVILTAACIFCYWIAGMLPFDALVHAMTTVSTGGFANYGTSFAIYDQTPWILWLSSAFMIISALPFVLYIRFYHGDRTSLFNDMQVRSFVSFIAIITLILTTQLWMTTDRSYFSSLTHTLFNLVSVITTSGYASEDYTQWGYFALIIFFYITFIGGCSGSTAGGIKVFRFQLARIIIKNQLRELGHTSAVVPYRYNGKTLDDSSIRSTIAFCALFFATIAVLATLLALVGLDPITALTGAATAVANVGPGLGDVIGPAGSFASLPDVAKWLLCIGMLLGRLEIITVLILFTPYYWRQ
ncbi:trk system potassium uptake protein TrkH [Sinobacterium caligoides]|uniref:Trk system potassium uptake protein n=1 Tax=Sinobacterium caligoides TaxID=933926 RepID=A0A3N2DNS7_9GAMM|nr:TrkH family potassium uptake protein [Sinobacterium caligoides]ROS01440.1 trk system potassium uptake protein TrkH [Sinobacterium caligoides]